MASLFPPRATDATYADDLGTEIVTIYVGPERKKYAVHKNLLTSQSDYFDKALNGGFKEAEESSIHLEEDDPAAIALLIGWLYRGVIPGPAAQSVHIEGAFPPSTIDKVVQPVGGTSVLVDVHTEQDPSRGFGQPGDLSCFQTILCHPRYKDYSSEELRLADYSEGRKYKAGSQDLPYTGPDLSSSGMYSQQRNFHVWPAPTPPTLYGSMPLVGGGVGAGAVTRSAFGAFPPQGPTGFGSNPLVGGGIGGVALSAASSLATPGSLFGNPRPAGSSLFGPSAVASSGGVFVNMGSQSQSSNGGLLGSAGSQSQSSSGGLFGGPASQGHLFGGLGSQSHPSSGGLFGGSGSQVQPSSGLFGGLRPQSQNSSGGLTFPPGSLLGVPSTSTPQPNPSLFPRNPTANPFASYPIASPFGPVRSGETATQPAQSGSIFGNPSARGDPSAPSSGGPVISAQAHDSTSSNTHASGSQPASSLTPSPTSHSAPSGSSRLAIRGGNGFATSNPAGSANSPQATLSPGLQTTTSTASAVDPGNQISSSESSNQTPIPAGLFPGSIPSPVCHLGTEAQSSASSAPSISADTGMTALTAAVKSALDKRGGLNSKLADFTLPVPTRGPQHSSDSEDSSDDDRNAPIVTERSSAPSEPNRNQPFQGSSPSQSVIPRGPLLSQTTQNPPPAPFSFAVQERPASSSASQFSSFNPPKFGTHTTNHNPFDTSYSTYTTPSHQLALLNLTLFAETTCWPTLYNASITSYVSGERTLTRPPPLDHISLIYERTHDESSLRRWAVDSLAAHKGDVDMSGYMGLLVDYEGFLEGVLKKLREKGKQGDEPAPGWDGAGGLKYRMLEHGKKNPFGGGKDKNKGKGKDSVGNSDMDDWGGGI